MIHKNNKNIKSFGFTAIELLIVMAIFGVMVGVVAFDFGGKRNNALLENTQASLLSALEKVQNMALTGVVTGKQCVRIEEKKITLFKEEACSGSGEEINLPAPISTDQSGTDIIFDRISGKPNLTIDTIINLFNPDGQTKNITITPDGRIIGQ